MSYDKITISTAMRRIRNSELVLPAIQRDFVWSPERIYLFLDSLMRGYPIGTMLFWNARQRVQYREFEQEKADDTHYAFHIKPEGKHGTLVLDGQQRLQSLYIALEGTLDGRQLYLDVLSDNNSGGTAEAKYQFEFLTLRQAAERNKQPGQYWIPLSEINQCKDIPERRRLVEQYLKQAGIDRQSQESHVLAENVEIAYSKLKAEEVLNYYTVDPQYGEDMPPTPTHEILEIFVRVNSGGQVLSKSDLMFSLMQLHWEGAAESIDELLDELNTPGFFDFDKDFVLRCALVCCGKGARYDVDKLRDQATVTEIEAEFPHIVGALTSVVEFLVTRARILDGRILGSYNSLIPFVYFLYHDGTVRESNLQAMTHALYLSLMTGTFSRYADSRIDGIINEVVDTARQTEPGVFPLSQFLAFVKRREGHDRIDNWLLQRSIPLLMNILEGGTIFPKGRRRHRPEVDHIFPASKLRAAGYEEDEVNDFANLRLISKRNNVWKSNQDPKPYFDENPGVAEQYLIPSELLDYDQYREFLLARRKRIWDRIQTFLGLADDELPRDDRVIPGEENAVIDRLEQQLRDLIHATLAKAAGDDYWKQAIPSQVQQGVKTRIQEHLSRHPNRSWHDYASGRSRLDFCDISDYETIILAKTNWSLFEPVFRKRGEFERHMSSVRRFRNSIKHSRKVDTVERLNGEAGILWLRRAFGEPAESTLSTSDADRPTPEDYHRLMTRMPVPRGQQRLYKALYDAGDAGLTQDELVDALELLHRIALGGVLGALGTRVNGTPGYGQKNKPGIGMVLSWERIDNDLWRYCLRPEMREALESLNPGWLHETTP